jgi:hypothetical protein
MFILEVPLKILISPREVPHLDVPSTQDHSSGGSLVCLPLAKAGPMHLKLYMMTMIFTFKC